MNVQLRLHKTQFVPRRSLKARFTSTLKLAKVNTNGQTFPTRGGPCVCASKNDQVLAAQLKQLKPL